MTLDDFTWEITDASTYAEAFDSMPPAAECNILVDVVPGDSMNIRLFLCERESDTTFRVHALTQREGFIPVFWVGSRPITAEEFVAVDDPHRYGFMFVSCVRKGVDLVCTPWSYRHAWEGLGTRRGEPVVLADVVTVRVDEKGITWVGLRRDVDLLARVCAIANHGTDGYMLRSSESGNAWSLEISSTHRLWCTA